MTTFDKAHGSGTLPILELVAMLRRTETALLRALGVGRGVDPDLSATVAVNLSDADVRELCAACDEVIERADQVQQLVGQLSPTPIEFRLRTLQVEAEAALAGGVADIERVEVLARCLSVRTGYRALAAMLRCTDCHQAWTSVSVGDVLALFRDAQPRNVREVTAMATASPDLLWTDCTREQVRCLAAALERYSGALPGSPGEVC